jgi:hypothetical protein
MVISLSRFRLTCMAQGDYTSTRRRQFSCFLHCSTDGLRRPIPRTSSFQLGPHGIASRLGCENKTMTPAGPVQLTAAVLAALMATAMVARAEDVNDYPTSARAEYVFGCLKANGETRQAIEQCSCSIDVVASLVPYDRYVTAETVLSMSQVRGNLGGQFRTSEQAASALNDLRRAQAEAEVRCF